MVRTKCQTMCKKYKYVFGPVASRRLGCSLGVDLLPFKTCSYDCVYCEVGLTTRKTTERREYVALADVIDEIKYRLKGISKLDFITISGCGEPTLYSRLGELISRIKQFSCFSVAVLTNGSMLWNPQVRNQLSFADLVVPSLDAADEVGFQRVNRPHSSITFQKMLQGLIDFSRNFSGKIWLEILLVEQLPKASIELLASHIYKIAADKIQLHTVSRPPAEPWVKPVSNEYLELVAKTIGGNIEIVANSKKNSYSTHNNIKDSDIISILRRRPCTLEDIMQGLNISFKTAQQKINKMEKKGLVFSRVKNDKTYFSSIR